MSERVAHEQLRLRTGPRRFSGHGALGARLVQRPRTAGARTPGVCAACAAAFALVLLVFLWRSYGAAGDARLCEPRLRRFMRSLRLHDQAAVLCGSGFTLLDDVLHLTDEQCVADLPFVRVEARVAVRRAWCLPASRDTPRRPVHVAALGGQAAPKPSPQARAPDGARKRRLSHMAARLPPTTVAVHNFAGQLRPAAAAQTSPPCRLRENAHIVSPVHRHRIAYRSAQLLATRRLQEDRAARRWSLAALLITAGTVCLLATGAAALLVLLLVPGAAKQLGVVGTVVASEVRIDAGYPMRACCQLYDS